MINPQAHNHTSQSQYPNPKYNIHSTPTPNANNSNSYSNNHSNHQKIHHILISSSQKLDDNLDVQSQEVQINCEEAFKEHKQFLERYKKQRDLQLKKQILEQESHQSSSMQQKQEEIIESKRIKRRPIKKVKSNSSLLQLSQSQAIKLQFQQYIESKMRDIYLKLKQQLIQADDYYPSVKYKIFTELVQSKTDIQRIAKQKRFIRSQIIKEYYYQEPPMPIFNKLPIKFRIKTQSIYNQSDLCKKAKNFINKIQNDQQNLLGKHLIRKKIESIRKEKTQKQQSKRVNELIQIKREQRKGKAELNLLLLKEKVKISQLINFKYLENFNASRYSIVPSSASFYKRYESINIDHHTPTTSQNHNHNNNLLDQPKRSKQKTQATRKELYIKQNPNINQQPQLNIKSKIAIRKYKNLRPTQYDEERTYTIQNKQDQTTRSNQLHNRHNQPIEDQGLFKEVPIIDVGYQIREKQKREIQNQEEEEEKDDDEARYSDWDELQPQPEQQEARGGQQQLMLSKSVQSQQVVRPYSEIQNSELNIQFTKMPTIPKNQKPPINRHKNYPSSSTQ